MAELAKQAIEQAAVTLLSKKPISKITVKEIVELCGVNRQTFYYHFDDIYDLLRFTFQTEATKYFFERSEEINSPNLVAITKGLFHFMRDNRTIVLNAYDSDHRTQYTESIKILLMPAIMNKIEDCAKEQNLSEEKKSFLINFYFNGCCAFVLKWIEDGLPDEYTSHLDYYLAVLNGSLEYTLKTLNETDN